MIPLQIPLALDDEKRLCDPETAEKGKNYYCPSCENSVILKRGDFKIPHFAHKNTDACNQETILHKTAKQLIVEVISEWKSGKIDAPILKRECKTCRRPIDDQSLPDKVEYAVPEYRTSHGFVVDIALMVANEPAAAIEIRVTHAVDENKADSLPIPFIELEGQKVIDNPYIWEPIRDNNLRYPPCKTCEEKIEQYEVKIKRSPNKLVLIFPATLTTK